MARVSILTNENLDALFQVIVDRTSAARVAEREFMTWCRCGHKVDEDCEHKQTHLAASAASDAAWLAVIQFLHGLPQTEVPAEDIAEPSSNVVSL